MRLFAQLSWYFRREWQRYLGAVALRYYRAILQLIPPKVVGYVVDGVTEQHYTAARVMMWGGTLVLTGRGGLPAALCLARAAVRRVLSACR